MNDTDENAARATGGAKNEKAFQNINATKYTPVRERLIRLYLAGKLSGDSLLRSIRRWPHFWRDRP